MLGEKEDVGQLKDASAQMLPRRHRINLATAFGLVVTNYATGLHVEMAGEV